MKARQIKGLDPSASLADGLELTIRVRLDELHSFVPSALDPARGAAMHDMRIAAKRLRYLLELGAFCFGDFARTATKRCKELQDVLGEIHDCDVMLPLVLAEVAELRVRDAAAIMREAAGSDDVDMELVTTAPHRAAYRGLELYAASLQARRALLFARFVAFWDDLGRRGFRARLEHAIAERAAGGAIVRRPARRAIAARPAGVVEPVGGGVPEPVNGGAVNPGRGVVEPDGGVVDLGAAVAALGAVVTELGPAIAEVAAEVVPVAPPQDSRGAIPPRELAPGASIDAGSGDADGEGPGEGPSDMRPAEAE